ncbi:hypothetical protein [Actinoplanes sp. NBRC 103695]|uniref:hypothetical protein n=1 Tax=Actinoplanes sp. NBRC 103695 TaxID=3032202 RepID=UPI0024A5735E|nr:hypothetical protein [Actinoplanes sp. NBRC 103695]GLY94622.1 hypothetical protein Acsp02_18770 [Actinoplanes sp. NBRC 103695]
MKGRLILAAAIVAVLGGVVAIAGFRPRGSMPEVVAVRARCSLPSPPTSDGGSPLVPDRRYDQVQLCDPAGGLVPVRTLDDEESAELVRRLNALPPGRTCAGPTTDLHLRYTLETVVVSLHLGPCDAVSRGGVVRSGAADLHRWATEMIGDGVPDR